MGTNKENLCPADIYTDGDSKKEIGCPGDGTDFPVTDTVDKWLCSNPCTLETPCLWDLEADPREEHECAKEQPAVVSKMVKRLKELSKGFGQPELVPDNGNFCKKAAARSVPGIGSFLGPWVDSDSSI